MESSGMMVGSWEEVSSRCKLGKSRMPKKWRLMATGCGPSVAVFWSRGKWSVFFFEKGSQGINYVNNVARLSGVL